MSHGETPSQLVASLERARGEGLDAICLAASEGRPPPRHPARDRLPRDPPAGTSSATATGAATPDRRPRASGVPGKHGVLDGGVLSGARRLRTPRSSCSTTAPSADRRAWLIDPLRFSLSSYNTGAGNAIKGYRAGDPDRTTAHGNYGRDVLDRLRIVTARLDGAAIPRDRPVLREGLAARPCSS